MHKHWRHRNLRAATHRGKLHRGKEHNDIPNEMFSFISSNLPGRGPMSWVLAAEIVGFTLNLHDLDLSLGKVVCHFNTLGLSHLTSVRDCFRWLLARHQKQHNICVEEPGLEWSKKQTGLLWSFMYVECQTPMMGLESMWKPGAWQGCLEILTTYLLKCVTTVLTLSSQRRHAVLLPMAVAPKSSAQYPVAWQPASRVCDVPILTASAFAF